MKKICPKYIICGFTLIELLVVIAIVAILSGMVMVSMSGQTNKARDAQRKSDLGQYRIALENYSVKQNGIYPSHTIAVDPSDSLCTTLGTNYIASCLHDPGSYTYQYLSNGTGSPEIDATKYILWAQLEKTSSWWYVCSSGVSLEKSSIPELADCP